MASDRNRVKKILICGFYGAGNLGDELILYAVIKNIREKIPDTSINVMSFDPEQTKNIHGIDAVEAIGDYRFGIAPLRSKKNWEELRKADLILMGGGGLFQDVKYWPTISRYLRVALMAKILGKPVLLFAVGAGPIDNAFNKRLMSLVCNEVDFITVRDKESKDLLEKLNVKRPKIVVTADPVFSLREEGYGFSRDKIKDRPNIGFFIRRWPGLSKEDIAGLADWLIEERNAKVTFIPMEWTKDIDSDLEVEKEIINLMHHKDKAELRNKELMPGELIENIRGFDVVVSVRLHPLIISAIYGIPAIALSYNYKVESLFRDLDMTDLLLQLQQSNFSALRQKIDICFSKYDDIKRKLIEKTEVLKNSALVNVDILKTFKPLKRSTFFEKIYCFLILLYLTLGTILIKIHKKFFR